MDKLKIYTRLYSYTHNYRFLPSWVLTPLRRAIRFAANKDLPRYFDSTPINFNKRRESNLIVSFTSFPARIEYVYLTVESLMRQTILPSAIILWLSREQFQSDNDVPERLRKLQGELFQIRFVDGDIRSHKKYYYVLSEFPESRIILVDDDIFYCDNMIEKLLDAHNRHPFSAISRFAFKTERNEDGSIKPYNSWPHVIKKCESMDNFLGTGAGTLLCPSMLYKDVTDISLALNLTPIADDVWVNAMLRLSGVSTYLSTNANFLPVLIKDDECLFHQNVDANQNDRQIKAVNDYYFDKLGKRPF